MISSKGISFIHPTRHLRPETIVHMCLWSFYHLIASCLSQPSIRTLLRNERIFG
ncbi:hypothetical protein [Vibrio gallaecicus]|uniref:hypothetical protein n=1 Tax=Vibrio gallaecicus TaxID=552386 RepID=UPI0025B357B3|nr:hypothetical protein [Vibrio gallaecicus]MDN3616527.1 hypothetical protein [Vibrio gallaecicus]